MVTIDKTNSKPDNAFLELYQRANPSPGTRPKVPVLHVIVNEEVKEEIVLCESLVITEFIAAAAAAATRSDSDEDDLDNGKNLLPLLLPSSPTDCARIRLFTELCGSSTFSFVPFTRVQHEQQLKAEFNNLQEQMIKVNAFLAAAASANTHHHHRLVVQGSARRRSTIDTGGVFFMGHQFSLAEVHLAPFVQRCCGILPPPYDPLSICQQLELTHLELWIQKVLERESVVATASWDDIKSSREKLIKRLARIKSASFS